MIGKLRNLATIYRFIGAIPIIPRAAGYALLLAAAIWYLAPFLLRNHYSNNDDNPLGVTYLVVLVGTTSLGVFPIFSTWLWLPDMSRKLSQWTKESGIVRKTFTDCPVFQKRFDVLPTLVIIALAETLFIFGLHGDGFVEWYESVGWWGYSFMLTWLSIPGLVGGVTLFRILTTMNWFTKQLENGLKLKVMDPDDCGGMAVVGNIFGRLTMFSVVMGFWMAWSLIVSTYSYRIPLGELDSIPLGFLIQGVLITTVYFLMVWGIIYRPVMATRKAMLKEREALLKAKCFSERFDTIVNQDDIDSNGRIYRLKTLRSEFAFIKETYPVWPFPMMQWRGLSVLTILPPALGIAAALVQILSRPGS